jgi:hypothetical protein
MKYQFFLREQPLSDGNSQSYLVIVPANDAEARAQTAIQGLVTRHQMHACVNLPFGNGYKVSFRLSYTEMDGMTHPLLLIISSEFGAFKLPFEAGRQGYMHFHQTYSRLRIRLLEYQNRKKLRIEDGTTKVRRLEHWKAEEQESSVAIAVNGNSSSAGVSRRRSGQPTSNRPVHPSRRAANEPDARSRKPRQRANTPTKKESSPAMNFLKWMIGGMLGAIILMVLLLGATSALAAETVEPEKVSKVEDSTSDKGFNGFPVPDTDIALIQPKQSASCSIPGFRSEALSGLVQRDRKKES